MDVPTCKKAEGFQPPVGTTEAVSNISGGYVSDRILIYALQTLSGPDIFLWVHQCPSKVIYLNMAPRLLETFQLA